MKYDKFFKLAKEAGIEEAELYISESSSLSFSLFHSEIDSYENNKSLTIEARGIVNGRFGAASCDVWNEEKCRYLVKEIKENALVNENDDPAIIFAGSPKYRKVTVYNKDLEKVPFEAKLEKLLALEKQIRTLDPRVVEVGQVAYQESFSKTTIMNTKGLNLTNKSNFFFAFGVAVAASPTGQIKSEYDLFFNNDFSKFDPEALAKNIVNKTVSQLGGEACASGKYKAVFAPEVVASLLPAYINHASSDEVQKQSSLFSGKLGQKIASKKVTVEDRPLDKSIFAAWFDDEGVATSNKTIIKNGVLETYLYNLKTAAKENRESTGNGQKRGSSIEVNPLFLTLKPGKKSQEELFAEVKDGVYITSVSGIHAGLNRQSGDFSLQSSGFLIKDGKLDHGLDIITVSGNLLKVFEDVLAVGNDSKIAPSSISCPSILVKSISVSGK